MSKKQLGVVKMTGARVQCPEYATPEQKAEWDAIVASHTASFFRPADVPLLYAFCVASALYKKAAAMIQAEGITIVNERGTRTAHPAKDVLTSQASAMAQMATKLRMTPQSRYTEKTVDSQAKRQGAAKRPWEATGTDE